MILMEMSLGAPQRIDKEAGIMYGVKILGRQSKNGREYSDNAMAQAKQITEGLGVNINHPPRQTPNVERSMQDNFGWLEGVETKADGNYGNLHYLKEHPFAGAIIETAERRPQRFGLSINAEGKSVTRNGKQVVESIDRMRSVDIVQNPATTCGLFESEEVVKKTMKQFVEGLDPKAKGRAGLIKLMEMDSAIGDMPAPDMAPMDAGVEPPAELSADEQSKAAFRAMVIAAFDDESLDTKATLARIKQILDAQEKLASDIGTTPDEGDTVEESKKDKADPGLKQLQEEVATLKAEKAEALLESSCMRLLESADVAAEPVRLEALKGLKSEASRKALIESWPKKAVVPRVPRPGRSAPILESTADEIPKGEKFLAALKR